MSLILNGDGSIQNLNAGGLPSATVTQATLATPVAGTGPAFSAASAYVTSVPSATTTVLANYNTAIFDTASAFTTSTGKFQPTVAGYYFVTGVADFGNNSIGAASVITALILKNGTIVYNGGYASSATSYSAAAVSGVVYLNGSTDYVQIGCYHNAAGTASGVRANFSGFLARAA